MVLIAARLVGTGILN